jgi:hypothetical protein
VMVILISCLGCFQKQPGYTDGQLTLELVIQHTDPETLEKLPVPFVPVRLINYDYCIPSFIDSTNEWGAVSFDDIPFGYYNVNVTASLIVPSLQNPDSMVTRPIVGNLEIFPDPGRLIISDTVHTIVSGTQPGLKINEIYCVGPPNSDFYCFDQFIELYNSSEDTVFLDGMVVCRIGNMLSNIIFIFQFPGVPLTGREYPVFPGQFVVLAQDAINHREERFNGEVSVDLSNADWEFHNSLDYGDPCNDAVPDIENIEVGYHLDFMISLWNDVIIIADGSDVDYLDGLDITSVIDCVEYDNNVDGIKNIEEQLDRGSGGFGLVRYSGQSLERILPGFDTNNSTVDFEIIESPTVGYHHEQSCQLLSSLLLRSR